MKQSRICPIDNRVFTPKVHNQRYCCEECRAEARNTKKKEYNKKYRTIKQKKQDSADVKLINTHKNRLTAYRRQ